MDFSRDYYEILGLESTATSDDIKKAYKKLAKKYHPDINKSSTSEELFKLISEAYEVLSDDTRRTQYDLYRKFDLEYESGTVESEGGSADAGVSGSKKDAQGAAAGEARQPVPSADGQGLSKYRERRPQPRPSAREVDLTRTQALTLAVIVPGFYQISAGEKRFGYALFGIYFIFWALAFYQSLTIGILAIIVWLYSFYDAYSHSEKKAKGVHK